MFKYVYKIHQKFKTSHEYFRKHFQFVYNKTTKPIAFMPIKYL